MKCVECLIQLKLIHYTGLLTPGMGIIAGCVNDTVLVLMSSLFENNVAPYIA